MILFSFTCFEIPTLQLWFSPCQKHIFQIGGQIYQFPEDNIFSLFSLHFYGVYCCSKGLFLYEMPPCHKSFRYLFHMNGRTWLLCHNKWCDWSNLFLWWRHYCSKGLSKENTFDSHNTGNLEHCLCCAQHLKVNKKWICRIELYDILRTMTLARICRLTDDNAINKNPAYQH